MRPAVVDELGEVEMTTLAMTKQGGAHPSKFAKRRTARLDGQGSGAQICRQRQELPDEDKARDAHSDLVVDVVADVVEEDNMDVVGGSEDATARGWRCHAKKDDVGGCKSKQVKSALGTRGGFRRANVREMYGRFSLFLIVSALKMGTGGLLIAPRRPPTPQVVYTNAPVSTAHRLMRLS